MPNQYYEHEDRHARNHEPPYPFPFFTFAHVTAVGECAISQVRSRIPALRLQHLAPWSHRHGEYGYVLRFGSLLRFSQYTVAYASDVPGD